ncbi:MAG TPA: hypothetical protein EYN18_01325 [Nitrospirales bacterium]|nr:hypothetical protein [Nitrospirales bacterium]HIN33318.1 hypothetical protein [Nitrospirales bacterium]HIO21025.1 hypothetical protein [Nitrospirales bacterium]
MDAIRPAYAVTLIAIISFIGISFVSCSTPQSPSSEEIREHADAGFDRLSAEERAKKQRSGYGR